MNEQAMNTLLNFLGFDNQLITELEYLIKQAEIYQIKDEVKNHIDTFDQKSNESFSAYYKRSFFSEFSWRFCELVCSEFYPEIAISKLEDFCLFHHDIWLDNEEDNPYYNWFLVNDLTELTIREAVEKNHKDLQYQYEKFFTNNQ